MNDEEIDTFEKCEAQIEGLYEEIGLMSKKSPSDAVNKFKLKFVNAVLTKANGVLGEKYRPFVDFSAFDEESCPTSSDVVMMLSQYLRSLDKYRQDNTRLQSGEYRWIGSTSHRRAKRPRISNW